MTVRTPHELTEKIFFHNPWLEDLEEMLKMHIHIPTDEYLFLKREKKLNTKELFKNM